MNQQRARREGVFIVGSFVAACTVMVDRLPDRGESLRASRFLLEPGGKGFNVAVGAARLGARVDGLFAVGADRLEGFARRAFAEQGLPGDLPLAIPGATTGGGVGLIEPDGANRIAVCPAANDALDSGHADAAAARIAGAALVYAQFEAGDAVIARAFAHARAAGVSTVLNPWPFRPIVPAIAALTDVLLLNQTEAQALSDWVGAAGPWCQQAGIGTLIVTQGAQGASLEAAGRVIEQPAFAIAAIDTTGAGDGFAAALIVALAQGRPLAEALREGCAAGALVATRHGVLDALPDRAMLAAMVATRCGLATS